MGRRRRALAHRRGRTPVDAADDVGDRRTGWDSLTPSERAVAELVATGLTNPAIAERLFVSPNTVKGHVSAALRQLSATSRAELPAIVASRRSK